MIEDLKMREKESKFGPPIMTPPLSKASSINAEVSMNQGPSVNQQSSFVPFNSSEKVE